MQNIEIRLYLRRLVLEISQEMICIRNYRLQFQKMDFIECTPSVNFNFEDQQTNSSKKVQFSSQEATLFQLSNTNNKNITIPQTGVQVSQLNINKEKILQTTPSVLHIKSQDFFQEFSSKFMVKFQQSQTKLIKNRLNIQRQQIDNEQVQDVTIQNSIQDFKDVRLSFPADKNKENYFGISINNQKGLKSQIISFKKKGCFGKQKFKYYQTKQVSPFQLHSAVRKNKDGAPQLPQIYQPKSCRNISGNLYFISKATPKDTQLAKKMLQRHCVQGILKRREKSSNLPKLVEKGKPNKIQEKKETKQKKLVKNESIFVKLPNLR